MSTQKQELITLFKRSEALNKRAKNVVDMLQVAGNNLSTSLKALGKQLARPTVPMVEGYLKMAEGALDVYEGVTVTLLNLSSAVAAGAQHLKEKQDELGALTDEDLARVVVSTTDTSN